MLLNAVDFLLLILFLNCDILRFSAVISISFEFSNRPKRLIISLMVGVFFGWEFALLDVVDIFLLALFLNAMILGFS